MSITLVIGPMFSGKTTELIRLVERKRISGDKCLIIKHTSDNRFDNSKNISCHVTTHSQICYQQCDIVYVSDFFKDLLLIELKNTYNVVAIEEGHFFSELDTFCLSLVNDQIDVIVSAIDSSHKQELFENVGKLIAHAETVIKLPAVCMRCITNKKADAHFTIRIIDSDEQILVGGIEKYQCVCRKCLNEFKKK